MSVRTRVLACLVFVAVLFGGAPSAALPTENAVTLVGRVSTTGGVAVPGAEIEIRGGAFGGGNYTVRGRLDGSYEASVPTGRYNLVFGAEGFNDLRFNDAPGAAGPSVDLLEGSTATFDAVLTPSGALIGGYLPAADGREHAVSLTLYRLGGGEPEAVQTTSSSLEFFRFAPVAAGTYAVRIGNYRNVATTYWGNSTSLSDASPVVVAENEVRLDVSTPVRTGGSVGGTVRNDSGQKVDADVTVYARRVNGSWVPLTSVRTKVAQWEVRGLPAGSYRLGFVDRFGFNAPIFSGGASTIETAAEVEVGLEALTTADAVLTEIPAPEAVVRPTVSGVPTFGAELRAHPGEWTASDASFSYQWYAEHAPIDGATGQTYVPTAAEVGKHLRVVVTATAPGHRPSAPTGSELTDRISTSAPTQLAVLRRTATTLSLGWNPSPAAEWYAIEVVSGSATRVLSSVDPTVQVTGLAPNSKVSISVVAHNATPSAAVTVVTATSAMAKPTSVRSLKQSKSSVTLGWTKPEGAVKYRVVYWTGKKKAKSKSLGNVSSVTIKSLKKKTKYSFYVEAVSADGKSKTRSSTIKVTTKKK